MVKVSSVLFCTGDIFFYNKETNSTCVGFSVCSLCCHIEEYRVTCNMVFKCFSPEGCIVLPNRSVFWSLVNCLDAFLQVCILLLYTCCNMSKC